MKKTTFLLSESGEGPFLYVEGIAAFGRVSQ